MQSGINLCDTWKILTFLQIIWVSMFQITHLSVLDCSSNKEKNYRKCSNCIAWESAMNQILIPEVCSLSRTHKMTPFIMYL